MNDQLCYEVDLNKFSDKKNIQNELKFGFNFLIDYNEDRQVNLYHNPNKDVENKTNLTMARNVLDYKPHKETFIYFNTIGKCDHIKDDRIGLQNLTIIFSFNYV